MGSCSTKDNESYTDYCNRMYVNEIIERQKRGNPKSYGSVRWQDAWRSNNREVSCDHRCLHHKRVKRECPQRHAIPQGSIYSYHKYY